MNLKHIRNFSIIAHIDHGKSTLADRLLEVTGTIDKRKMQDQVLDSMELERERGITIKMQPVRMRYERAGEEFVLNLIDTPGHIDFSYEVSRALKAVEGSLLLVDATQGVQAQTLTTLGMAREAGLTIIPVVSKIDSPLARVDEVKLELAKVLDIDPDQVLGVSGKTGEGVKELIEAIIDRVPPPHEELIGKGFRSLVFDFQYDNHRGVIVYVRVTEGKVSRHDQLLFSIAGEKFQALEVGIFSPQEIERPSIEAGEIGYIVTGIKQPGIASVGDTVTTLRDPLPALHGYQSPKPVVWASIYPESQDDFDVLRQALGRLRLSDSSFTHEEESSGILGRGFRCGFLGMLHMEIITERLRREFNLELVVTLPSISYLVTLKNGKQEMIFSPHLFPESHLISAVEEPWVALRIIVPSHYVSNLMPLFFEHEATLGDTETFGDNRTALTVHMPLREMMRDFFDRLKSASSGFASLSYEIEAMKPADIVVLEIIVADETVPAFCRIVSRAKMQIEAEKMVDKLEKNLPREMFAFKIQAKALGRILASRSMSAMKKDVAGTLSGGDITRKKKLREKQKKGKLKMKAHGQVEISQDVFLKMMRSDS